jgi:hypothetical protein
MFWVTTHRVFEIGHPKGAGLPAPPPLASVVYFQHMLIAIHIDIPFGWIFRCCIARFQSHDIDDMEFSLRMDNAYSHIAFIGNADLFIKSFCTKIFII